MTSHIHFDSAAYANEVEAVARAGGWTVRHLSPCMSGMRPWFERVEEGKPPAVYISTGIHGDEVSGPLAVLEMLKQPDFFAGFSVVIFPILNPDGLVRGLRGNAEDIDLNRDYRATKSAEIRSHIEALKTLGRYDAAMMLHEDFEGIGAYLYELNESLPTTTGRDIIQAMGQHVPIDERPIIEEVPAHGGVISRRDLTEKLGPIEERPDWPEAIYLSAYHTKVSYTTETPKPFLLEKRVQAQIAAVQTLMQAVKASFGRELLL